ncbi:hypothetical protein THAOC_37009, partial [Thalassiosira oceanica]
PTPELAFLFSLPGVVGWIYVIYPCLINRLPSKRIPLLLFLFWEPIKPIYV